MAKKDYIPGREGDLVLWLTNYKNKLPDHKATLGLSQQEVDDQTDLCNAIIAALAANTHAQQDAQEAREAANIEKSTGIPGIRNKAQQIKTKDEYTTAIGEDLGIVGDEETKDIENSQPKLTARKVESGTELKFSLEGFFDGVKIYRQRPGEGKQFIAIDTSSPYTDTDAQINGTSYTAWFLLGDNTVGMESDAVVVEV